MAIFGFKCPMAKQSRKLILTWENLSDYKPFKGRQGKADAKVVQEKTPWMTL